MEPVGNPAPITYIVVPPVIGKWPPQHNRYCSRIYFRKRTSAECREVARKFLKEEVMTEDLAHELTQELISEVDPNHLKNGNKLLFQLQNTAVEVKYFSSDKGSFVAVKTTVYLFGDAIINSFAFRCDRCL